jgi:eukaryotic-like serine/threonine-protein kinase
MPDLERLLADQRKRWERGERPRVERYLERSPELAQDSDAVLDLIYQEFVLRQENGESPSLEEYLNRFPHLGHELRTQMEVHNALENETELRHLGDLDEGMESVPWPSIPGYEIREHIGSGAFGVVYRAWQTSLRREVALKVIRNWQLAAAGDKDRLRREAQAVAQLRHPNIVQIYDTGEYAGCPFFSLEYVEGGSLDRFLDRSPQPPRLTARLIETVARAMHHAHLHNIVHCDLKPANILLQPGRPGVRDLEHAFPKITDFGLARSLDMESASRSGTLGGTLCYMAPEQATGRAAQVGPASDIHALGAILY